MPLERGIPVQRDWIATGWNNDQSDYDNDHVRNNCCPNDDSINISQVDAEERNRDADLLQAHGQNVDRLRNEQIFECSLCFSRREIHEMSSIAIVNGDDSHCDLHRPN